MFKPMLACSKVPQLEEISYPVYISPKLDGIRCIIGEDGKAYSRNGKLLPNKHIQTTLTELNLPRLDGELMIKGDFNSVQSAVMKVAGKPEFTFCVFDLVNEKPFYARLDELRKVFRELNSSVLTLVEQEIMSAAPHAAIAWEYCIAQGYEGAIVRSLNGPYKQGRSTLREGYLLKLKKFFEDEAVVTDYEELFRNTDTSTKQQANMYGAGMLGALSVSWKGVSFKVGSGFDEKTRKALWENPKTLIGKTITFKYQGTSKYKVPRFPVFKAFRDGY